MIVRNAGAADRYLRLDAGSALGIATVGNTFGHAASQHAVGVAAVPVPTGGAAFAATATVETFSSDGPRRIFFEADGTAITPGNFSSTGGRLLNKPDVAAADAVATSTPGFSPFYGTSAAAPHAAAIGALMVEAAGGPAHLAPAALREALTDSARDIMEVGVDAASGAGIAMAPDAVDAVDVVLADRNRAPTVTSPLRDRTFEPGARAVTIDLSDVFDDPDDDALTYSMQPVPGGLATRNGSVLTLTPGAPDTSFTVTVSASDPGGLTATRTFTVTVHQASPTAFTDHPLERGATPIRAIHFLELRARIDALRTAAGRPAFRWTDPVLTPGVTPIRRVHLTELRAALAEAYAAAGRAAPVYTDPLVTAAATAIRAVHLMELRAAVAALE